VSSFEGCVVKKFVVVASAFAAFGFVNSASAADMPVKAPVYATPVVAPYNWTGWYAGVNAGFGWGSNNQARNDSCAEPSGSGLCVVYLSGGGFPPVSLKPEGFIGGGQVGYNWQVANLVWGVEADFQGSGIKASAARTTSPPCCIPGTSTLEHKLRWFGTVRGRLGVPMNNWLFYGTGGLIYGGVSSSSTWTSLVATGTGSSSTTRAGWTIGAGTEAGFGGRWTATLEYLYFDLGRDSVTATSATAGSVGDAITISQRMAGHILRTGLNYRF
jgi:outer membrane immunogenic protein